MKLTWLGHACFLLEEAGYRLVIDPYTGVEGYPPLQVQANEVYCSHGHYDHCAVDCVEKIDSQSPSPFSVRKVESFHDDQGGAARGKNTIHIFTAGGVSVAHLGDLGHQLSPEQLRAIGQVDGVLVPVGGFYTLDAAGALAVCRAIGSRWVVPMHYRHAPYGLPAVGGVEPFLALWDEVRCLDGPSFVPDGDTRGVIVPKYIKTA